MNIEDIDDSWEAIETILFDQNMRLLKLNDMLQTELALMSNYMIRHSIPTPPTVQ